MAALVTAPLDDGRTFKAIVRASHSSSYVVELRATGGPVAGEQHAAAERLSPYELRVALLVADGRTNPEVAAELYMSRKTVEHHLSLIYRKLGLRSRTELARELGRATAAG
ncbi:helix-turn-helix transcriptional regulator, partial [Patulibacter sp. NPDC049589]|uniref:helix-turn-helix domain-containing protein n=1 Tax=Patulibacter sp. NPDC049589 TaxID=3154731 RepID=UPI0034232814